MGQTKQRRRAWLFFTFLHTYIHEGWEDGTPPPHRHRDFKRRVKVTVIPFFTLSTAPRLRRAHPRPALGLLIPAYLALRISEATRAPTATRAARGAPHRGQD